MPTFKKSFNHLDAVH